jgi:hypothetical protein
MSSSFSDQTMMYRPEASRAIDPPRRDGFMSGFTENDAPSGTVEAEKPRA